MMLRVFNLMLTGTLVFGLAAFAVAQERHVEKKVIVDEDGNEVEIAIITEGDPVQIIELRDDDDKKKQKKKAKRKKTEKRKQIVRLHEPSDNRRLIIRQGDGDEHEFMIDLDNLVDCPNCDVEGKVKVKIKGLDIEGLEDAISGLEDVDIDVRSFMPRFEGQMKDAMRNFKFFSDGRKLPGGGFVLRMDEDDEDHHGRDDDDDEHDGDDDDDHHVFRLRPFGRHGQGFAFGPDVRRRVWTEIHPHVERGISGARKHIERVIRKRMHAHDDEEREHEMRGHRRSRGQGRDAGRLRELREEMRELRQEMRELDREIKRLSRRL